MTDVLATRSLRRLTTSDPAHEQGGTGGVTHAKRLMHARPGREGHMMVHTSIGEKAREVMKTDQW
jgi:hypothetical protein